MPSPARILWTVLAGAGLGALPGYLGQGISRPGSLIINWRRGGIYGAFLGLLLLVGGCHRENHPDVTSPAAPIEVRVAPVERSLRPQTLLLPGTIRPLARASVAARMMGTVERADFVLGQTVAAGEVLVTLSAPELTARRAQASAALEQARRELARETGLATTGASAGESVRTAADRLHIAEATLAEAVALVSHTCITAPFAGVIVRKSIYAGDLATPGTPLFEIEARDRLRAELQVPEKLPLPAIGSAIPVSVAGGVISARLAEISPAADPATHTREARVELPAGAAVRSGQFVHAIWPAGNLEALLLPVAALGHFGQLERAFVVRGGRAELRLIRTGVRDGNSLQVLSGLLAGESVILSPGAGLRDDDSVRVLP